MALRLHGLSAREREVAGLVLDGKSTQDIARTMFISPYTVQDHLKTIFDKAGVGSRGELVGALFFGYYLPERRRGSRPSPYGWFLRN